MENAVKLCIFGLLFVFAAKIKGECSGKADLVIAIPGSFKVPHFEFESLEGHLHNLVRYFAIEPDQFNIGLILYGESAVTIATPQPYKNRLQINTRITLASQRISHFFKLGFRQNVKSAVDGIRRMLTSPPHGYGAGRLRPGAAKIGIILTYGPTAPEDVQSVIDSATKAKKEDKILMYALSANGSSEDFPHLGTDYCRLFSMGNFATGLEYAFPDLAKGVCSSVNAYPPITPTMCFPGNYTMARNIGVTCQVKYNMVMPDPNNCAYFYRCEYADSPPIRFTCPLDTLYDPLSGNCNQKNNVACYNDLICPTNITMSYVHPMDCHKFVNCFDNFIPHVQSCPDTQVFDQDRQMCRVSFSCIKPSEPGPASGRKPTNVR